MKMLSHLARFRFGLSTLLIAMAWSGVVVWVNVTPRVRPLECQRDIDTSMTMDSGINEVAFGWPWTHNDSLQASSHSPVLSLSGFPEGQIEDY